MTRPIVWAIGVFASVGVAATFAGDRLAELAPSLAAKRGPAQPPPPAVPSPPSVIAAARPVPLPPSVPPQSGFRVETIDGDRRGHFSAEGRLDGTAIQLMVDTGASSVALREEDAERAGIYVSRSDFTGRSSTANGMVEYAPVRLRSLRIGSIEMRDVDAVVIPRGKLGVNLLGMTFLKRLRSFDITGNRITLKG